MYEASFTASIQLRNDSFFEVDSHAVSLAKGTAAEDVLPAGPQLDAERTAGATGFMCATVNVTMLRLDTGFYIRIILGLPVPT